MKTRSTRSSASAAALLALPLMLAASLPAQAATITASAFAAQAIPSAPVDASLNLVNGDFTILANPGAGPGHVTGDGVDETTRWTFDFSSHPEYAAALADGHIVQARLTFRLATQFFVAGAGPWTDIAFATDGTSSVFPGWNIPSFLSGTLGTWEMGTITTDLIGNVGVNGTELFNFMASRGGQLPFQYADDAVVGFAQLTLVTAPVPEPAAWMMLSLGLLPLAWRKGGAKAG
ncbi:MAG: PEP-CTERM sorting domain-containing protein [Rubrivivax sp.]|nr:PEP-CTERM sorting domain-containing protein [Rubrivivax sp.]